MIFRILLFTTVLLGSESSQAPHSAGMCSRPEVTCATATIPVCGSADDHHRGMCVGAEETAELVDGKCSICMREHRKSTVTMNPYGSSTLMYCGSGYYDEDGKFIPLPNCNTTIYTGRCSNGHLVIQSSGGK